MCNAGTCKGVDVFGLFFACVCMHTCMAFPKQGRSEYNTAVLLVALQEKYEKEVSDLQHLLHMTAELETDKGRQSPAGSEDLK